MKKIILFDPSMGNNTGMLPTNLGDIIIYDSVNKFLEEKFVGREILRISTHVRISKREKKLIKEADLCFVGGTNLLSSNLKKYNQWKSNFKQIIVNYPVVNNAILLGVGWWQYQERPTILTSMFYRKLLSTKYNHSVRDSYTSSKLNEMNISNSINTSCPTTWNLNGISVDRKVECDDVLIMLTDYHPNHKIDNELLKIVLESFAGKIYFFPQGNRDLVYLKSLNVYKRNQSRFKTLNHDINELNDIIKTNSNLPYIGTRLHGGMRFLQNQNPALILANDNRSKEIGKDINLAVSDRGNTELIRKWINFDTNFGEIKLPLNDINTWRNQFS